MHHRLIAGLLVLGTALAVANPAMADGTGDAFIDGDEIGAGAQNEVQSGPGTGGSNACHYEILSDDDQNAAYSLADDSWGNVSGFGPGAYYRRICALGNGQTSATIVWIPDPTAGPAVDPAVLAEEAFDRTLIPAPEIRLNPPEGREQVVNVPTWMWIDPAAWAPVSATASAGAVTVTATATPTSVSWDMGNGDVVVCAGPGTPYDSTAAPDDQQSDCTYTYGRSSAGRPGGAFTMRVTTTWEVTWSVSGAPGGGSLGTAQRTTTSAVRVAEIQAVNE
jgi:hypothetical protein